KASRIDRRRRLRRRPRARGPADRGDKVSSRACRRDAGSGHEPRLRALAPARATAQSVGPWGGDSASLRVLDPTTGKSVERSVALAQAAPTARARLLALAIAELVAASWSELESNPQPKAPPAEPLAPVEAREAARRVVEPRPIE